MTNNRNYTLINADGSIGPNVHCNPAKLSRYIQEGQTAVEGVYSRDKHKMEGGKPVLLSETELAQKPNLTIKKQKNGSIKYRLNRESQALMLDGPVDLDLSLSEAKNILDDTAGLVRAKFNSKGEFIDREYDFLSRDAQLFAKSNGSDVGRFLRSYAEVEEIDIAIAASKILSKAEEFESLLFEIATIRRKGIKALNANKSDHQSILSTFVEQLRAL